MRRDTRRDAWISLASVPGIGEETFALLLATFGDAPSTFEATLDGRLDAWIAERTDLDGRPPFPARTLVELRAAANDPAGRLVAIDALGLWTSTPLDSDYPERLRDLPAPPAVIHGLGNPATLRRRRAVGVVGTRRPTPAGRLLAARIAGRLVECRATVVSGLAVGIDGAAHAATLEHGGATVGVIGAGHCQPGPRAHKRLRDEVVRAGGAVVSEHHPETHASKGTYPRRNRIIAALSDALVVVEAPRKSGALITAKHALELGRPVFVAPGRIGDWSTEGSLALLRDTPARPLVGLDELTEDLGYFESPPIGEEARPTDASPAVTTSPGVPTKRAAALSLLGPSERAVAERLCAGPAGLDLLVSQTGLPPGVASGAITLLLMRGWAQAHGPAFVAAGPLAAT
ncbi:MAG TPA: DNA-processing protein DprA [Candidatus Limnocylindrales bacterium]|nr:DNA-processing protein DprA [Candidatus Limnocylindrales bacterium]